MPRRPPLPMLALFGLVVGVVACDARPTTSGPTAAPSACPKCECKCSCPDATSTGGTTAAVTPASTSEEAEELSFGLTRKLAKRDPTCLADLDRLAKIAPRTEARMQFVRGQCLMLAGRCADGATIVRKEMAATTELLPEQLERTVESYTSMYCEGPMDDRGELLRALAELQKGAYQGNIGIRACTNATRTVARLRGRVRPKDDEDWQVVGLENAFPFAAAGCLARAGDCAGAWKVFNEEAAHLRTITDPKVRAEVMRTSFDSTVPKCKGRS
ncbi:MAG: hypothetical protein JNK45_01040 [Myxococcales bacterium]|nr:hypothetical protein [Myxococcales bacterium]